MSWNNLSRVWPLLSVVVVTALFALPGFTKPQAFFWDENYHVPSAQRYLHGVFFFEPHPPLGKMLIALGEWIVDADPVDDAFIRTEFAPIAPRGPSMVGYRLFPLLFTLAIPLLFFFLILSLTHRSLPAAAGGIFLATDPALIVHGRGAMLDAPLIACVLCALLFLTKFWQTENVSRALVYAAVSGLAFGLALSTKLFALVLFVSVPLTLFALWPHWRRAAVGILLWCGTAASIFLCVFILHTTIARTPDPGFRQTLAPVLSTETSAWLAGDTAIHSRMVAELFLSWVRYFRAYEQAVPPLDRCDPLSNGSPWYRWPLQDRAILYHWDTADRRSYRSIVFVPNPVSWGLSSLGIVVGIFVLIGALRARRRTLTVLATGLMLLLYMSFMLTMAHITRTMYLPHYLLPHLFGLATLLLVWHEPWECLCRRRAPWPETGKNAVLCILVIISLGLGSAFQPFMQYLPLTNADFRSRALLPSWRLSCPQCPVIMPQRCTAEKTVPAQ